MLHPAVVVPELGIRKNVRIKVDAADIEFDIVSAVITGPSSEPRPSTAVSPEPLPLKVVAVTVPFTSRVEPGIADPMPTRFADESMTKVLLSKFRSAVLVSMSIVVVASSVMASTKSAKSKLLFCTAAEFTPVNPLPSPTNAVAVTVPFTSRAVVGAVDPIPILPAK